MHGFSCIELSQCISMYICMVCNTLVRRNSPGWLLLQLKVAINQDPGISIDFRYFMKCIWKCLSMALTTVGATIYLKGTDRLWRPRVLIWSFACTVIGQMCVNYGFWQHKYIAICAGIVSVSVCTNTVCCSMGVHWLWFYIAWVCGDTVMAHVGANMFYCRTIVCWMVFLQHKCALALSQYKYMPIQSVAGIMSVGWL